MRATPVIVLSHGFWERSLGSDATIVGRTLTLNRTPFTVIGIAPQGFTGTLLGGQPGRLGADGDARCRAAELRLVRAAPRTLSFRVRAPQAGGVARPGVGELEDALRPAGTGVSGRQQRPQRGGDFAAGCAAESGRTGRRDRRPDLDDADDRRRHRSPDCLRQRRQPAPGAGDAAAQGDRGAAGSRRETAHAGASAPDRERGPRSGRRGSRDAARVLAARDADRGGAAAADSGWRRGQHRRAVSSRSPGCSRFSLACCSASSRPCRHRGPTCFQF